MMEKLQVSHHSQLRRTDMTCMIDAGRGDADPSAGF